MKHKNKKEKMEKVIAKIQGKKQCYLCTRWLDPMKGEIRAIKRIPGSSFKGDWICNDCFEWNERS